MGLKVWLVYRGEKREEWDQLIGICATSELAQKRLDELNEAKTDDYTIYWAEGHVVHDT